MPKYIKKKLNVNIILIATIFFLVLVIAVMSTAVIQRVKHEKLIAEMTAIHEEEMNDLHDKLQEEYETQLAALKKYYEYGGDISQIELEAEYVAKVIYGTAKNHSDADKRAVVWCILNRVEHYGHPDTVQGVCEQPKQWMGYSSENPVLADIYDLALAELKTWHSGGHRPLSNDYIYLTWSSDEILLRDTFEENKSTRYWRMK